MRPAALIVSIATGLALFTCAISGNTSTAIAAEITSVAPVAQAPSSAPSPSATPGPRPSSYYEHFIVGDFLLSPKTYNELSPGNSGSSSYDVRAAVEFPLLNLPWMLEGDYRRFQYGHNANQAPTAGTTASFVCPNPPGTVGCVTSLGGYGRAQAFVPAFTARENDFDARFALRVLDPRLYIGAGYFYRTTNYGYPTLRGLGLGAEKLPDLNDTLSVYGSAWYYPSVQGSYGSYQYGACAPGTAGCQFFNPGGTLSYRLFKYQAGATLSFGGPFFLDLGLLGDRYHGRRNAPTNINQFSGYAGLGIHF